ncbi:MAG: 3-oxoacyl-ACP reductase [Gammaproteobacteria bacterium]|nr:MAG: 3-oxoacyl-ACP reductase [Gammaproteobacteria bacterium]
MSERQTALVTGATRGIGAAIAEQLASDGFIVFGTATSKTGANSITKNLNKYGGGNKGYVLNVTNSEQISNLIKEISPISVLVNNAGITSDNLLMRMSNEEWLSVINTNLSSIYRTSKAVIRPMMKAKYGRIINISSVVGSTGNPGQTNYAAAKAGIDGFTKALSKEIGSRGITVNSIAPGFIESDMTSGLPAKQKEILLSQIPANRLGTPQDVAKLTAFIASDKSSYINGQTLHINGGMFA